ncbi:regulator [Streptomyces sp. WZ.A104]|uniref:ATP-binding protein n=1 Tax=Streptomyces sp. WZ.A104 TaxID=2023771 RepID=UPI000BBC2322|nr:NB-ARC domain-containing protein [Streptomyces sp. WZ.A104]PCG83031.1 regulator [Streptomyces sp. WZ.A104]
MGNLPVVTTSFVGRDSELVSIERALRDHRLVTLTGSGGVGKSRLALRTAERVQGRYADGVWWADLSHLHDDQLLTTTVCDGVGLLDHSPRRPVAALCEWLADRRLLLVLDCCERVVGPCGQLVAELLSAAPGLTVLATSREPFGAPDEHVIEVPPLSAGADGDDAVRLFHDRAAAIAPDLRLDAPDSAAAVADICRRLDGIPLAVELACAQLRGSSAQEITGRLASRMDTLSDDTVWPRRHRALRTTIGWSHELCAPLERLLWARLSVFRGVVTAADAEAVCAGGPLGADAIAPALERLADQSVLRRTGDGYLMLDTLREYGAMWLAELAQDALLADRHARHFAQVAVQAYAGWLGPSQVAWYHRIADTHADLCAALDHLLAEDPEKAMEMAGCAGLFWSCCGHLHQARTYLERVLALPLSAGPHRTRALWALGITLTLQGDHEAARRTGEECHYAARRDEDAEAVLLAAHSMSFTYLMMGKPHTAHSISDHALRHHVGDPADAPSQLRCRVIRLFALSALGRLDEAYEEATRLQRISLRFGEHWARAYADHQLALIHLLQGRPRHAESHARAMLASKHELHDSLGIALGLDLLAGAIAVQGNGVAAARASGTGHTYWRMIGHPHRGTPELGAIREQWELRARQAAGDSAYERAYLRASADDAERGLAHALERRLP